MKTKKTKQNKQKMASSQKRLNLKTATAAFAAVACLIFSIYSVGDSIYSDDGIFERKALLDWNEIKGIIGLDKFSGIESLGSEVAEIGLESENESEIEVESAFASEYISEWTPRTIAREEQTDMLIAHGGGSYQGYPTTNSVEALTNSIDNGFSLIELDMGISSDGKVIMIHDFDNTTTYYYQKPFDKVPTKDEFLQIEIHERFHTMSLEELIKVMEKSKTFKVVTDAKEKNIEVLSLIAEKYPDYLDRFVPQIYAYDEYEAVIRLGYKDIILTLYNMYTPVYEDILNFYQTYNIFAITAPIDYFANPLVDRLVDSNVKVYRHPISSFETLKDIRERGNYGVYTSTLLPRELTAENREYYITMPAEDGTRVKLTDYEVQGSTVADIVAQEVHGLIENDYRIYYIGEERLTDQGLDKLPYGKQQMSVEIWHCDERLVGTFTGIELDYYIWKDENGVRILDPKYEYRADSLKVIPNIQNLFKNSDMEPELSEILTKSFISCAGEYYFYNDGKSYKYMIDDEFMYAIKDEAENIYVPFAEAAKTLGADSVAMDSDSNIITQIGGLEYTSPRDGENLKPLLHKTIASAKYLSKIFGREYIEDGDMLIILPKDTKISPEMKSKLCKSAKLLYKD